MRRLSPSLSFSKPAKAFRIESPTLSMSAASVSVSRSVDRVRNPPDKRERNRRLNMDFFYNYDGSPGNRIPGAKNRANHKYLKDQAFNWNMGYASQLRLPASIGGCGVLLCAAEKPWSSLVVVQRRPPPALRRILQPL